MLESLTQNLINIGWAMLIFLRRRTLRTSPFRSGTTSRFCMRPLTRTSSSRVALRLLTFRGRPDAALHRNHRLCPCFANQVGWAIPEEYSDLFADLIIIGAVLLVACKYIKEAFTKFVAILNAKTGGGYRK